MVARLIGQDSEGSGRGLLYVLSPYLSGRIEGKHKNLDPLLRRRGGPISKHVHVKERIKILVMDLEETDARTDCAGVDLKQFNRPTVRPPNVAKSYYNIKV
jgi:hypothetical protein